MRVATGLATGSDADASLVTKAVQAAMKKLNAAPTSVLLFLTSEFASDPQSAILAAAKAANCTQIIGCSASGIFTEEDWVLDSAAAAAMVFTGDLYLTSSHQSAKVSAAPIMTLAAPNAINSTWLNNAGERFGGVSGDATGQGPFSVWENGKGVTQGYCELSIANSQAAIGVSHGLKIISAPRKISSATAYDVHKVDEMTALDSLKRAWQKQATNEEAIPYHRLMAVAAKKSSLIERGEYLVASIISENTTSGAITLSRDFAAGDWLCWAIRDTDEAQIDIIKTASATKQHLHAEPEFALLFSCLGRGPYFYDGNDKDLALLKTFFPNLPIIGFYGNGEIATIGGVNELLQFSVVLGLFAGAS